jgi:hypothetical protein
MGRPKATSRDPEEFARATEEARRTRAEVAREVSGVIAEQVAAQLVAADIMGGRAEVAVRLRDVAAAERRGDRSVERAAWLELAVAAARCVAAIDFEPPRELSAGAA